VPTHFSDKAQAWQTDREGSSSPSTAQVMRPSEGRPDPLDHLRNVPVRRTDLRGDATSDTGAVWSVAFSADGTTLASGNRRTLMKLWDAVTGRGLRTLKGNMEDIWQVAFSADGKTVASASPGDRITLWEAAYRLLRPLGPLP